jgi:5'-nucleotidase
VRFKRPGSLLGSRAIQGGLVAVSLGAVIIAPLAATGPSSASAPTIGGASSLTDALSVSFQKTSASTKTSTVHVLAWNDFHGNLEPAGLNIYGKFAGGAAYLAKLVESKQALYGRSQATVLAGDNIGAAPLANALFNEEPAIITDNLMNVDFSSVGNHEFDKGSAELLRIQNGGCKPDTGCLGAPYAKANGRSTNRYPGADFQYLSANVLNTSTSKPLFPAYGVKTLKTSDKHSVQVGFIGEVLHDTPTIVTPSGVAGLSFTDEATAANKAVKDLKKRGVKIPILVIHQGGFQSSPAALNGCAGNLDGSPIAAIAAQLDPSIKVIISGHTHAEYRCTITTNGVTRLITSAASFGRILSDLTLTVNDKTDELVSADATNTIVENALNTPGTGVVRQADPSKADPVVQKVVDQYVTASAPLANKVIGKVQGDLTRTASGESTLGDVIADAQLASTSSATTGNAVVAFMNPGGIRADLLASSISSGGEAVGEVTYGEAFTVQPFGNSLVTKTMTGAQIRSLLEQQFTGCGGQIVGKTLQVSAGLVYQSATTPIPASPTPAQCAAQIGTISINGTAVDPAGSYRVTMNNFLATGGDGFTVFNAGTDVLGGAQDIDSFAAYLATAGTAGLPVPTLNRILPLP